MLSTLLLALCSSAAGHGLDAGRLVLEVEGEVVRATATPGVASFPEADADRDGRLDRAEVAAARAAIRDAFADAFRLHDVTGAAATCEPASVSTIGDGEGHVRVSTRCALPRRPEALAVALALPADRGAFAVEAVRVWRVGPGRWFPEGPVERATLRPDAALVLLEESECAP